MGRVPSGTLAVRLLRYTIFGLLAFVGSAMVITGYRAIAVQQVSSSWSLSFPTKLLSHILPEKMMRFVGMSADDKGVFSAQSFVPDITIFAIFAAVFAVLLVALLLLHFYERKTTEFETSGAGGYLLGIASPAAPLFPVNGPQKLSNSNLAPVAIASEEVRDD